ncbi:hypothetical protein KILIM_012_00110 [Kineosphaera limosa NBRC 100340]|uniref:Uncharacterized protein n=1 Tax=Kineosphaera limosa NBRC 100340 TaxID=1184609 RepID=K6WRY3_9MICO|nr:hypothetical protein KILIM_012_00110 [Kineosphaera limosa NBRC 100340]
MHAEHGDRGPHAPTPRLRPPPRALRGHGAGNLPDDGHTDGAEHPDPRCNDVGERSRQQRRDPQHDPEREKAGERRVGQAAQQPQPEQWHREHQVDRPELQARHGVAGEQGGAWQQGPRPRAAVPGRAFAGYGQPDEQGRQRCEQPGRVEGLPAEQPEPVRGRAGRDEPPAERL